MEESANKAGGHKHGARCNARRYDGNVAFSDACTTLIIRRHDVDSPETRHLYRFEPRNQPCPIGACAIIAAQHENRRAHFTPRLEGQPLRN